MRKWWIMFGVTLVAIAATYLLLRQPEQTLPPEPPTARPDDDAGVSRDAAQDGPTTWLVADSAPGDFVALLDGAPTEAEFVIGAAGVYPPLRTRGPGVTLPVPSQTLDRKSVNSLEVYARSINGEQAYWGDVELAAEWVELAPATEIRVQVVDANGAPQPDAAVRLGRQTVGLVLLTATTDAEGWASFPAVPGADYTAMVSIRGFRSGSTTVRPGEDAVITIEGGRAVTGVVTTPNGKPAPDVLVALHGGGLETNPLDDIPADLVQTDTAGEFRAFGIPGAQVVALAIADGWAPSVSTEAADATQGPVRLEIVLRAGHTVRVEVVDKGGTPVPGARVEWSDETTGFGATGVSDRGGLAIFHGVPIEASLRAHLGRFETSQLALASIPRTGAFKARLVLDTKDMRIWRYRVDIPDGLALRDLVVHDGLGARCNVSTDDGRDFVARACGDGDATFKAVTDRGVVQWTAGPFVDGDNLQVPSPTLLVVHARGKPDEAWSETAFSLVGAGAVVAPIEVESDGHAPTLRAKVFPGKWRLRVSNPRIGLQPFEFAVGQDTLETAIELVALHLFSLLTVDAYGAAVTGAQVMIFKDDKLVDVSRSAGQLPVEFRVRPPFDGVAIVVDPRRGEGRATLSSSGDEGQIRVSLREDVLTLSTPSDRLAPDQLSALIGARLVRHDRGYVLDFEAETPGTRAGLKRSDRVVSAWPEGGGGVRVVVHRRGTGYVDVLVR